MVISGHHIGSKRLSWFRYPSNRVLQKEILWLITKAECLTAMQDALFVMQAFFLAHSGIKEAADGYKGVCKVLGTSLRLQQDKLCVSFEALKVILILIPNAMPLFILNALNPGCPF